MPTRLIVNADDFGNSSAINRAVAKAHHKGVLTSASLMVTGSSVDEAVSIAKENPRLAVGLHLVLSDGCLSVLPKEAISSVVDESCCFPFSPIMAGLRYSLNSRVKRQIKLEIEAQFEAFESTGLKLSHVDGHQHMHAHPSVLPTVLECAQRFGACGIRIPNEPFWINVRADRSNLPVKLFSYLGNCYLTHICRQNRCKDQFITADYSIGTLMSGGMTSKYVIRMLQLIRGKVIEVYFHPAEEDGPIRQKLGPNVGDLEALCSAELKSFVQDSGFILSTYPALAEKYNTNA